MSNIIAIHASELDGSQVQSVDARELHTALGVKIRFNDWVVRRVQEYGFIEEKDFYSKLSKSIGGRPSKEYELSIDMAKELSMVEKTDKGREVRQYFIECERKVRGLTRSTPQDPVLAAILTTVEVLDTTILRVNELEKDVRGLKEAKIIPFPVKAAKIRFRAGPKLHQAFKHWLKEQGVTMSRFCEEHSFARSSTSEAMRGLSNGPISQKIRRKIKKLWIG